MNKPTTMDDLGPYLIEEMNKSGPKVCGLAWNVRWSFKVSCSHRAPRGHQTNFMGNPDRPTHFPGWFGRVWIRFDEHPDFMSLSDILSRHGIYPGSGGGGAYGGPWSNIANAAYLANAKLSDRPHCYSWDVKIFDLDWPLIEAFKKINEDYTSQVEEYEKSRTWLLLNSKYIPEFKYKIHEHSFEWTDPETLIVDQAFIDSHKTTKQ